VANAVNALGRLATVKGEFSEALEYHRYGRYLCETNDYSTGLAWMFNALGEFDRVRGDHGKAAEHLSESATIFQRLGNLGAQMLALQNLAFAMLRDNPSRSETLLQKTLRFWMRGPARHGMSLSRIGLSRVELSRGNTRNARRQLSIASQVLSQIGVQLELGDRVDYEIALERWKNEFGHDPLRWEDVGMPSLKDLPGRTALTERETGILQLTAQGLTDKQIAEQLVISPHTVNAHLKSIYRKLSVNNRTAAVAAARSRHIM
jgi:ATP/maltotriose-dependent transcriptional regulator MalT